jgi:hypothetical protein
MYTINEYKVRPVIRYVVTEYRLGENCGGSSVVGEFASEQRAEDVAKAMESLDFKRRNEAQIAATLGMLWLPQASKPDLTQPKRICRPSAR